MIWSNEHDGPSRFVDVKLPSGGTVKLDCAVAYLKLRHAEKRHNDRRTALGGADLAKARQKIICAATVPTIPDHEDLPLADYVELGSALGNWVDDLVRLVL